MHIYNFVELDEALDTIHIDNQTGIYFTFDGIDTITKESGVVEVCIWKGRTFETYDKDKENHYFVELRMKDKIIRNKSVRLVFSSPDKEAIRAPLKAHIRENQFTEIDKSAKGETFIFNLGSTA